MGELSLSLFFVLEMMYLKAITNLFHCFQYKRINGYLISIIKALSNYITFLYTSPLDVCEFLRSASFLNSEHRYNFSGRPSFRNWIIVVFKFVSTENLIYKH